MLHRRCLDSHLPKFTPKVPMALPGPHGKVESFNDTHLLGLTVPSDSLPVLYHTVTISCHERVEWTHRTPLASHATTIKLQSLDEAFVN